MSSALRKTHLKAHPIPQLIPPWQRVENACPQHPDHPMRKVIVLGRELWECAHLAHITGEMPVQKQPSGGLLISPIRARAARRVDGWQPLTPPQYRLPAPQTTGPMRPVVSITPVPATMADIVAPVEIARPASYTPEGRPAWVQTLIDNARPVDVTEADCAPVLDDDVAPTELRKSVRDQRAIEQLIAATKESEVPHGETHV